MSGNDDFRVRPGRIRSTRGPRTKPFLAQALQAAQKAGGLSRGSGSRSSRFGRGRAASLAASRMLQARGRGAMVKARVVRQMRSPGALRAHIVYLQRDGVTRDGSPGQTVRCRRKRCGRPGFCRTLRRRPASFPVHRLARRRRRAIEFAQLYSGADGPGLARSRHAARLGRRRPLEHRASSYPYPCAGPG